MTTQYATEAMLVRRCNEEEGAHLLRESERSREQAAAPEASTIGFSSHVRRRREGKAEQNDMSDK